MAFFGDEKCVVVVLVLDLYKLILFRSDLLEQLDATIMIYW